MTFEPLTKLATSDHTLTLSNSFCLSPSLPQLPLKGPFATFRVRQEHPNCEWTGVKFSSDGKKILISTTIGQLKLIDAFQGHEISTLQVDTIRTS